MTHAYDECFLRDARRVLATSIDYAVNTLGYDIEEYYDMFLKCDLVNSFEQGDPFVVSGKSGIEIALLVVEKSNGESKYIDRVLLGGRSREYWTGWAIAFYQWYKSFGLRELNKYVSISTLYNMYDKYHEMDRMHFVDRIDGIIEETRQRDNRINSYLQRIRKSRGLSQSELAKESGIPLKTIQHYEQGDKSLEKANAKYVIKLAKVLSMRPEELLQM